MTMRVSERLAQMRAPIIKPWANEAYREIDDRDKLLLKAIMDIGWIISDDLRYPCIWPENIESMRLVLKRLESIRLDLLEMKLGIHERQFADDPRK